MHPEDSDSAHSTPMSTSVLEQKYDRDERKMSPQDRRVQRNKSSPSAQHHTDVDSQNGDIDDDQERFPPLQTDVVRSKSMKKTRKSKHRLRRVPESYDTFERYVPVSLRPEGEDAYQDVNATEFDDDVESASSAPWYSRWYDGLKDGVWLHPNSLQAQWSALAIGVSVLAIITLVLYPSAPLVKLQPEDNNSVSTQAPWSVEGSPFETDTRQIRAQYPFLVKNSSFGKGTAMRFSQFTFNHACPYYTSTGCSKSMQGHEVSQRGDSVLSVDVPFPSMALVASPETKKLRFGVSVNGKKTEGATSVESAMNPDWARFDRTQAVSTSNGWRLFLDDIRAAAFLGVDSYAFTISWSKVIDKHGIPNIFGLRHYQQLAEGLKAQHMQVTASLFNWDLPQFLKDAWTSKDGIAKLPKDLDSVAAMDALFDEVHAANKRQLRDSRKRSDRMHGPKPAKDGSVDALRPFIRYVDLVFTALNGRVDQWIPINDPVTYCLQGYGSAQSQPYRANKKQFSSCVRILTVSNAQVIRQHKRHFSHTKARVGVSMSTTMFVPADLDVERTQNSTDIYSSATEGGIALHAQQLLTGLSLNPYLRGKFTKAVRDTWGMEPLHAWERDLLSSSKPGFIAVYANNMTFVSLHGNSSADSQSAFYSQQLQINVRPSNFDGQAVGPVEDHGRRFTPQANALLLAFIKKEYGSDIPPLILFNIHQGCTQRYLETVATHDQKISLDDRYCAMQLERELEFTLAAIQRTHLNVEAYFPRQLVDEEGRDNGLVHIDHATSERIPKTSFYWYKTLIQSRQHPNRYLKEFQKQIDEKK